mgnify:CR=1 FL=1
MTYAPRRAMAVQSLFLLANHLARLCYQEFQLRQRIHELTALNRIAIMLAEQTLLNAAVVTTAALQFHYGLIG